MLKKDLPTPSLIVSSEVLDNNLKTMANNARRVGVNLRPHIKTHKNIKIAHLQLAQGAKGIACATIGEAQVMFEGGITDIFVAYPLFGHYQLQRAAELTKKCQLMIAFDSLEGAKRLNEYAKAQKTIFDLSLIINTGGNRDGVLVEEALTLALEVKGLPNVNLSAVMTHEGHIMGSKTTEEMIAAATESQLQLVEAANNIRTVGIQISTVSSGSTPACQGQVAVEGITEWRPGTYVFNDLNEIKFVASREDCALKVLATVVSNPAHGRYILDAGSKVLSEARDPNYGHGLILCTGGKIERVNEEHAIVQVKQGSLHLGQRVEIIPVHVCTVVNLSSGFYLEKADQKLEYWPVDARGLVW